MPKEPFIAVIDDDESFRLALVDSLLLFGYRVREFASAEDFLAGEAPCDCVVSDIQMPGMSGLDLKQLLATRGSKMPFIMITARAGLELEAKVASSGAMCLLKKPFKPEALVDCIEKALNM